MMLSRVAENFYWFGRHVERVENTARLLLTYSDLVLDLPLTSKADWYQLVEITGSAPAFNELHSQRTERDVMQFLIDDASHAGSIRATTRNMRENLRTTRDRVAREVAEAVNQLRDLVDTKGPQSIANRSTRNAFLRNVINHCQIIRGHISGSMSRNEAFQFIRFGRALERADMTTRIMDVRVDDLLPDEVENLPAFDALQWMSVLRSLSGYQMYRREVRGRVRGRDVIDFLFHSETFPRSIHFSLTIGIAAVGELPRPDAVQAAIRGLIEQVSDIRSMRLEQDHTALRAAIDNVQSQISAIHMTFAESYFAPPEDDAMMQKQVQLQV